MGDWAGFDWERDKDPLAADTSGGVAPLAGSDAGGAAPGAGAAPDLFANEGFGMGQVAGGLNFGPSAEGGRVGTLEQALGAAAAGPAGGREDMFQRQGAGGSTGLNWASFQDWLAKQPRPGVPGGSPGSIPLPGNPVGAGPQMPVRGPLGGAPPPEGMARASGAEPGGQPGQPGATDYGVPDINELRAEPWTNQFEQAAIARADELASQRYNALRQQRAEEMSRRGIGPDSPFYQSEMRKVDTEQARESANFRRELQIEKMNRRQQNLAQARQVELTMNQLEQQRLQELMALVTGQPYQTDPNIAALQANQQNFAAQRGAGEWRGVGDLLGAWMAGQRQPITIGSQQPPNISQMAGLGNWGTMEPEQWQRWASNISDWR